MIYHNNNISREILLKHLNEGVCQVVFTKVKDNTTRTILCTLNPKAVPSKYEKSIESIYSNQENLDIMPIWDLTEEKWKSFKLSKMIEFRSPESLKDKKSSHRLKSKTNDKLNEMKKTALQNSQDRVKQQKQNIDEARAIMDRLRNEAIQRRNEI